MKNYFIKQFEFEIWANEVLAETIEKANTPDDRTLLLFSHLLSSYSMWLSRLTGAEMKTTLFQERTLAESKAFMKETFKGWKTFLNSVSEERLNEIFSFVFPLDGSKRRIKIEDAISHLITHSNYHRGQIIARLKGKVEPLPLTSYIVFASEME